MKKIERESTISLKRVEIELAHAQNQTNKKINDDEEKIEKLKREHDIKIKQIEEKPSSQMVYDK